MKKKKIIIIALFVLGIGLISYGIYSYINNNSKGEGVSNKTSSPVHKIDSSTVYIPITNYANENDYTKEVCVSKISIKALKEENYKSFSFDIINNTENVIKDKEMKVNFYHDNELINSFEYTIKELLKDDEQGLETSIELGDAEITKCEFILDEYKTEISSKEIKK